MPRRRQPGAASGTGTRGGKAMTVKFFAYLRDPGYAGCKELQTPAPDTVRTLGEQLSHRFGPKFRGEFFSPAGDQLGERIIVMVNGRRVEFLDGADTPLRETDTVQIFPVVAGG